MTAIFKNKGEILDPKMYRMIQTSKLHSKLLSIILLERIKPWYEKQILSYQIGFRTGSGTSEGILAIRTIQNIIRNTNQKVYMLITDMTAGFDTVVRNWAFQSIHHRLPPNCDRTNFEILENMYENTKGTITNMEQEIKISIGTRQGAIESPMIWALWIDWILRIFLHKAKEEGIKLLKLKYLIN